MSEGRSLFDTDVVKYALDLGTKKLKDQKGNLYYREECPVRVFNSKLVLASALIEAERHRSNIDEFKCSDAAYEIASNLGSTTSRQCYKDGYPPNMRAIAGIDCRDLEELWKSDSHGMQPVSYLVYWIVLIFTKNRPDCYVISSLLLEYVKENMMSRTHSALVWASKMPGFVRLQNGVWYSSKFKNPTAKPQLAQVLFLSGKRKIKMIGVRMLTRVSRSYKVTEDFKYVEATEAVGAKCLKGLTFRTYTSICKCKCCTPPREAFCVNRLVFCASSRVCCVGPAIKV